MKWFGTFGNNWNPFKRSKSQIYKPFSFFSFGASNVEFKKIYKASQDNKLLIEYFNNVAEVAAPPLKYSDGAAQITLDTENEEVKKLLIKPNYYQGFNEFFSLLVLYKRLFGEAIVDAFTPLKMGESIKPESLFLWSPQYTSIQTTKDKDFRFNVIESYIYESEEVDKDAIIVTPDKILHLKESNPNFINNQYLFGESRYAGCYRNIESIIEGYGAKVNLYKNGPQFIITGKSQGEFASMANTESVETAQKRIEKYGLGDDRWKYFLTDVPLDVKNASLNVAQLQILQNNQSDFQRLCDAQGIDAKVFSETTTFTNKESALKEFYNNAFRSEIDSIVNDIQTYLQRWWPDLDDLKPNYSQIAEIVQANNEENERLLEDCKLGLITRNTYFEAIGKERNDNPDFDKLFIYTSNMWISIEPVISTGDTLEQSGVSQEQLEAQARLRGSVGGVQGILAIQASVQSGTTDLEAAIITLIEIYGFDRATAISILGTPGAPEANATQNIKSNGKDKEAVQVDN